MAGLGGDLRHPRRNPIPPVNNLLMRHPAAVHTLMKPSLGVTVHLFMGPLCGTVVRFLYQKGINNQQPALLQRIDNLTKPTVPIGAATLILMLPAFSRILAAPVRRFVIGAQDWRKRIKNTDSEFPSGGKGWFAAI